MTERCRACGRPIADRRSLATGMGRACALRTGHVWRAVRGVEGARERATVKRALTVRVTTPRAPRRARTTWMQLDLWAACNAGGTNTNGQAGQGSPVVPAT